MNTLLMTQMAFIEGMGFDPFFRGFLSVMVGVIVLIGGTYLLVATNTGPRQGMLIAMAGLFGWNLLMGIVWAIYGIGWRGEPPTWELVEINVDHSEVASDGLLFSEVEMADQLYQVNIDVDEPDPDLAQEEAVELSKSVLASSDWRYLSTADSERGEAQSSADAFLQEREIYEAGQYLPLQFGGFAAGGKPRLDLSGDESFFVESGKRAIHWLDETILHPVHPRELIVIQTQAIIAKPAFPGQAPPVAERDTEAPLVSVIMERDRGGPIPAVLSGLRFTPVMFTIANGLLFAVFAWALHVRDRRQDEILAAAG